MGTTRDWSGKGPMTLDLAVETEAPGGLAESSPWRQAAPAGCGGGRSWVGGRVQRGSEGYHGQRWDCRGPNPAPGLCVPHEGFAASHTRLG